jgi:Protein of unknown function (DUF1350)
MQDTNLPKYLKISNSQVLLHPQPKGVIQFIGSFIFGSFPVCAYKALHQFLFTQGYSVILYEFPLNPLQFNHWEVALDLLKEQYNLKIEIVKTLTATNTDPDRIELYLRSANYLWLGHSLGCKYIALLEVLSQDALKRTSILQNCLDENDAERIIASLDSIESLRTKADEILQQMLPEINPNTQAFIRDQPSVLLAPEISNTVRFLRSGWRIANPWTKPNGGQTECLISSSQDLFNLTGIISFSSDDIAEDEVTFLIEQIKNRHFQPYLAAELLGCHFEPLQSQRIEILGERIDRFFDTLRARVSTNT